MALLIDRNDCSALVITCSDFRFKSAEREFAEAAGLRDDYDLLARPGSIRSLVQPRNPAWRESMLEEIRLLWSAHQFRRVLLVNHVSCRAYDDIATRDNELEIHAGHLRRAVATVEGMFSGVNAEPYLIDFVDGAFVATKVATPDSA
jgi:hypothetical protein